MIQVTEDHGDHSHDPGIKKQPRHSKTAAAHLLSPSSAATSPPAPPPAPFPGQNHPRNHRPGHKRLHWLHSQSFRLFWKTACVCALLVVPGLIGQYAPLPNAPIMLGKKSLLFWMTALAIVVGLYPFFRLVLHLLMYHAIPESWYRHPRWGNYLYYMATIIGHVSFFTWLLVLLICWEYVFPSLTYAELHSIPPLNVFDRFLGIFLLWTGVMGLKRVFMFKLVFRFNQASFLERVRESIFIDFIIDTLKFAKRKRKNTLSSAKKDETQWQEYNEELLARYRLIEVPEMYTRELTDYTPLSAQKFLPHHTWKRILDHFYSLLIQDELMLDGLEEEAEQHDDQELMDAVKSRREFLAGKRTNYSEPARGFPTVSDHLDYHHLHRFTYDAKLRKMTQQRISIYTSEDEKAAKLAGKFFRYFKVPERTNLDVDLDIMPKFVDVIGWSEGELAKETKKRFHIRPTTTERKGKQDRVTKAIRNYLLIQSGESGQLREKDLREMIQRFLRERKRLIASLSGMRAAIGKVNTTFNVILIWLLVMISLSILGVNAFGALISVSSFLVSFAFFFGQSARNLFESMIFLFSIHPYDVGDRIIVDGQNYVVAAINLLSTVMERLDGQMIYMYNNVLSTKDIFNIRRSAPYGDTVALRVPFTTPNSVLEELRQRATDYVLKRPGDYGKKVSLTIDSFNATESILIKLFYQHRNNMQVTL